MKVRTAFSVLLAAFLCGCSSDHFSTGHGDVGQFILQQAIANGGSPTINSLPVLSGAWRYSEDKDGVVIRMAREQYPTVEAFLRRAFGEPKLEPTKTPKGTVGAYQLSPKGGAIQFSCDNKQTQIIVLRPIGADEIIQAVAKQSGESK